MKPSEVLSDNTKWTQGVSARDARGEMTRPASDQAVCWCLWGAFVKAYGPDTRKRDEDWKRITDHLDLPVVEFKKKDASTWQDEPVRTFQEVHTLLEVFDL